MGEQMTARERVRAALDRKMPDRVPVFPVITPMHASRIFENAREGFFSRL